MKLAYLANSRFPSERAHAAQIAHMCQAFCQNGVEVDLIVNKRNETSESELARFFGFVPKFKVVRVEPRQIGLRYRHSYVMSTFKFVWAVMLRCRNHSYDLFFSREEWILWSISFFIPANKLVWESHQAKINMAAKRLFKKGVQVVAISEGIKEDYVQFGVPADQVVVAHDGIDDSFFGEVTSTTVARERLGILVDEKAVMYIGGFDTWKGVDTFCQSAELVYEDTRLYVIGGRADQVELYSNKYPKVTFLGSKPYRELKDHQQAADILVVPNTATTDISARYTSPLKLFAHMTSGKPLIISDVPSLTTVTGTEDVTVCAPDNPQSLAESIQDVFSSYQTKIESADRLKKRSKQYTWNNRATLILQSISGRV